MPRVTSYLDGRNLARPSSIVAIRTSTSISRPSPSCYYAPECRLLVWRATADGLIAFTSASLVDAVNLSLIRAGTSAQSLAFLTSSAIRTMRFKTLSSNSWVEAGGTSFSSLYRLMRGCEEDDRCWEKMVKLILPLKIPARFPIVLYRYYRCKMFIRQEIDEVVALR